MRAWGTIILIAGIIGLVAALQMDTSVSTIIGRVNNLGLMKDQQNYIVVSSVMVLAGLVMIIGSRGTASDSPIDVVSGSKTCPECAETIKSDARVCRYCGNRNFPQSPPPKRPRRTLFDVLIWDRTQNRR